MIKNKNKGNQENSKYNLVEEEERKEKSFVKIEISWWRNDRVSCGFSPETLTPNEADNDKYIFASNPRLEWWKKKRNGGR